MSIPTISNTSTTATDNRSTVRQSGNQPAGTENGAGSGVGNGNVSNQGASQTDAVSISAGNYAVDSQRLADKMLAFERSL